MGECNWNDRKRSIPFFDRIFTDDRNQYMDQSCCCRTGRDSIPLLSARNLRPQVRGLNPRRKNGSEIKCHFNRPTKQLINRYYLIYIYIKSNSSTNVLIQFFGIKYNSNVNNYFRGNMNFKSFYLANLFFSTKFIP